MLDITLNKSHASQESDISILVKIPYTLHGTVYSQNNFQVNRNQPTLQALHDTPHVSLDLSSASRAYTVNISACFLEQIKYEKTFYAATARIKIKFACQTVQLMVRKI